MMYQPGTFPNEVEVQAEAARLIQKYKGKQVTSRYDFEGFHGVTCPHCGLVIEHEDEWGNGLYMRSFEMSPDMPYQIIITCVCGKRYLIAEPERDLWVGGKRQGKQEV